MKRISIIEAFLSNAKSVSPSNHKLFLFREYEEEGDGALHLACKVPRGLGCREEVNYTYYLATIRKGVVSVDSSHAHVHGKYAFDTMLLVQAQANHMGLKVVFK